MHRKNIDPKYPYIVEFDYNERDAPQTAPNLLYVWVEHDCDGKLFLSEDFRCGHAVFATKQDRGNFLLLYNDGLISYIDNLSLMDGDVDLDEMDRVKWAKKN